MKTIKEMIEVMKAFDEGKEIQCKFFDAENWDDVVCPYWSWNDRDYRIKPEHKTRPMTFEEVVAYWKAHRFEIYLVNSRDYKPEECFITSANYEDETVCLGGYDYSIEAIYKFVTKEDGTKFEVEE